MDTKISKAELRKKFIARRKLYFAENKEAYEEQSQQTQRFILAEEAWKSAQRVGLYMAIGGEMDTELLCSHAFGTGKKVFLPRCQAAEQGQMDFVACAGLEDLAQGAYGILEPKPELPPENVETLKLDILIVPGVAFDKTGFRLGFGGGYYDRFIQKMQTEKTLYLGLAFSWQIVENLPVETWDLPMSALVSQGGIHWR